MRLQVTDNTPGSYIRLYPETEIESLIRKEHSDHHFLQLQLDGAQSPNLGPLNDPQQNDKINTE